MPVGTPSTISQITPPSARKAVYGKALQISLATVRPSRTKETPRLPWARRARKLRY